MKLAFYPSGKTEPKYLEAGTDLYLERLRRYVALEYDPLVVRSPPKSSAEVLCRLEGEVLLRRLRVDDYLVLLDEKGAVYTSEGFARWLEHHQMVATRRIVFASGGPYGFSQGVCERAQGRLSLSAMTFSHQMVRLLFVEQLYRAFTIIHGQPYHHV